MSKREQNALSKKTMVRIYMSLELELALERFMKKHGKNKGDVVTEFLLGSKSLQQEVERVREFYNY